MEVYLTGRGELLNVDADRFKITADRVLLLYKNDKRVASFSNWDGVVKV